MAENFQYIDGCATCGVNWYMPRQLYNQRYEDGCTFFCPNGHRNVYPGRKKMDEVAAAKRKAKQAEADAEHAAAMREIAERTCPWPTCDGRVLASPRGLRQHMVKAHGAPWASPELDIEDVGQVLNGRDPADVVN